MKCLNCGAVLPDLTTLSIDQVKETFSYKSNESVHDLRKRLAEKNIQFGVQVSSGHWIFTAKEVEDVLQFLRQDNVKI